MRSLRLLQKPPKCVAQLSGAVSVVTAAAREMMRSGSQDSIIWAAASNLCRCRHFKFSRRSRGTPLYGGAMPPIGARAINHLARSRAAGVRARAGAR